MSKGPADTEHAGSGTTPSPSPSPSPRAAPAPAPKTRTVVVLGAAYAGRRVAQLLAQSLPKGWRLVVIDRNTHFNHVYVFPRYTVRAEFAPMAFIPYLHAFEPAYFDLPAAQQKQQQPNPAAPLTPPDTPPPDDKKDGERTWIHGLVTRIGANSVSFTRLSKDGSSYPSSRSLRPSSSLEGKLGDLKLSDKPESVEETIEFDYAVYALGASLPPPVDVWHKVLGDAAGPKPASDREPSRASDAAPLGHKLRGVDFMLDQAETYKQAKSVLVVGGGALGIQTASDIKDTYPDKDVTLIHSREKLMPIYPQEMHDGIVERLQVLGVKLVLGERVMDWPEHPGLLDGKPKTLTTITGRVLTADLVLVCTGQKPLTALMAAYDPSAVSPTSARIRVRPTLHIDPSSNERDMSRWFAAGDCAETGSIQAGHTAWWQGVVVAANIAELARAAEAGEPVGELQEYSPTPPAIKVSLGMKYGMISNGEGTRLVDNGVEDLHADVIWKSHGVEGLPYSA